MTKALAAQGETQKSAEDLLSAVQKGSSADDLEKLLQDFNSEVNALLTQQNRPEYTYEKLNPFARKTRIAPTANKKSFRAARRQLWKYYLHTVYYQRGCSFDCPYYVFRISRYKQRTNKKFE